MSDTESPVPPEELEAWMTEVKAQLELDDEIDIAAILDLARDFAHNVARPAAPLTTFALGLAVGRRGEGSAGTGEDFSVLAKKLQARSAEWSRG